MNSRLSYPTILELSLLRERIVAIQATGKRIVFTNGCFDIIHPGHVDLLARAKTLGDVLVVALNTDASVQRLGKAPDRPINPLPVRAFVMAHLVGVDFVTHFDEDTPLQCIHALKPDVLVKGGDWPIEHIVGSADVLAWGGTVHSIPLLEGYSTTALLAHIRSK